MKLTTPIFVLIAIASLPGCFPEDEEFIPNSRGVIDRGIYQIDPDSLDDNPDWLLCDFEIIPNNGCWDNNLTALFDCHYDSLFDRSGGGWTGGDGTYSILLPDGRIFWFFGDTFLGTVNPDGSRLGGPLINNTVVLQQGNQLTTLFGGTEQDPKAFIEPTNADDWHWPFDGTVHNGELHLLLAHMERTGSGGMWDFQYGSVDLAIYSLPDLNLQSLEVKVPSGEISYGSCVLEDGDYTYIYGITSENLEKKAHVARAPGGDLTTAWEYYDGQDWVDSPNKFVILNGVSDMFSVIKSEGKYYLITQQIIFGDEIFIYESDTPVGPWTNKRTIYCTPESGGDIFTYNSFVHPELSINGELVVTYNVNSFDFWDLFEDATIYRPRFVRVENWQ